MIKIEIPDLEIKKLKYINLIKPLVENKTKSLIITMNHLSGEAINLNEGDFNQYKHITRKIINFLGKDPIKKSEFTKQKYTKTIFNSLNNRRLIRELDLLNLNKVSTFLRELISNNCNLIEELLVCDGKNLKCKNDELINKYGLDNEKCIFILKLIFDYNSSEIGKSIKGFFRTNNFVSFCPYCNLVEVMHIETDEGNTASAHQLDHFFDKARYPLLACSFFNLIPSHDTCNSKINKGTIAFTDKYHLNPYINGFDKNMMFQPTLIGDHVDKIDIDIKAQKGSAIRKQIFGSSEKVFEDDHGDNKHKEGNVNVFKLYSKYRDRNKEAEKILNKIRIADNGKRAIKSFLSKMNLANSTINYKIWYENNINTPFERKKFNDKAYSKFNRDIHDFYYAQDKKRRNDYIREVIDN